MEIGVESSREISVGREGGEKKRPAKEKIIQEKQKEKMETPGAGKRRKRRAETTSKRKGYTGKEKEEDGNTKSEKPAMATPGKEKITHEKQKIEDGEIRSGKGAMAAKKKENGEDRKDGLPSEEEMQRLDKGSSNDLRQKEVYKDEKMENQKKRRWGRKR